MKASAKSWVIYCMFCFTCTFAQPTDYVLDSLLRQLSQRPDSAQNIYEQLSKLANIKDADLYLSGAARLAQAQKFPFIYQVFNDLTEAKIRKGQLDSAIFYYQQIITYSKSLNDSYQIARNLNNVGTVYILTGDYSKALISFEEALTMAQLGKFELVVAATLISLADLYEKLGDNAQALASLVDAQTAVERVEGSERLVRMKSAIQNQMSVVYRKLNENDKALQALEEGIRIYSSFPDMHQSTDWTDMKLQYARLLYDMQNYSLARDGFLEVQRIANDQHYNLAMVDALLGMGKASLKLGDKAATYRSLKDARELITVMSGEKNWFYWYTLSGDLLSEEKSYRKAIRMYKTALEKYRSESEPENYQLMLQIVRTFQHLSNVDSANVYLNHAIALQTEIFKKESAKQLSYYQVKKDLLAAELVNKQLGRENELKESELIKRQFQIRIVVLLAVALLVVLVISFIAYLRIKRQNIVLHNFNKTIEEQRTEIQVQNQILQERQEEIQTQNEELTLQHEQLSSQRDQLERQNKLLEESKSIITHHNQRLERAVQERTLELAQSNENLRSQYRKLEQFNFITAHKIRGPVARILGLTNLFFHDTSTTNRGEYVDRIEQSARELDAIIFDLHSILEIQQKTALTYQQISLEDLVARVMTTFDAETEAIKLQLNLHLEVKQVQSVEEYLEKILSNLISNALKFRLDDRPLVINIQSILLDSFVVISVGDNGSGFALDQLEDKLFKPFERFNPRIPGKGLGLFMVKAMITHLEGHIHISSKPEEGTLVTISLPYKGKVDHLLR